MAKRARHGEQFEMPFQNEPRPHQDVGFYSSNFCEIDAILFSGSTSLSVSIREHYSDDKPKQHYTDTLSSRTGIDVIFSSKRSRHAAPNDSQGCASRIFAIATSSSLEAKPKRSKIKHKTLPEEKALINSDRKGGPLPKDKDLGEFKMLGKCRWN